MKLNKDKFIISEEFKTKQLIKSDKSEVVFFSQTFKEFERYENTFYFTRIDTKNIYDYQYIIYITE